MLTRERREFLELANACGWPMELKKAWIYCNDAHRTPFPTTLWTAEMVREMAETVMTTYNRACMSHTINRQQALSTGQSAPKPTENHSIAGRLLYAAGFGLGFFLNVLDSRK